MDIINLFKTALYTTFFDGNWSIIRCCKTVCGDLRGLERGPLCLVRTIVELLELKNSGSDLEKRY
jgi:hypothetical protein